MTSKTNDPPQEIIDYEGSDYQTKFWEDANRDYEDQVEAVALRRMLPAKGELLLEVGAGAGRNTSRYQGHNKVVLLDYSFTQLEQATSRLGKSERYIFVAADIYKLPFVDGLFDTSTMIRVLHHMTNARSALGEIERVMAPGATFILEYANKRNIKAILRYLTGRQEWNPFERQPIEFVRLNFNFHPKEIRNWLKNIGFSIERQLTVSHFRMQLLKRVVPLRVLVFLDSIAQLSGGVLQLTPSVFVKLVASVSKKLAEPSDFFRCPQCQSSSLIETIDEVTCQECTTIWPIRNGIFDFRMKPG